MATDEARGIDMAEDEGIVETTHFVIDYKKNRRRIAVEYNVAGAKAHELAQYLEHVGISAGLLVVMLKPILTEDSLRDFQRRVDALKSLEICVPTDSIGQIQKYSPGLATSMAASKDFFNCSKLVFRPDFDLSSQNQTNSAMEFVKTIIQEWTRFIIAALTIIVTFKANITAKKLEESVNGMELLFNSDNYGRIVNVFQLAIIELVIAFAAMHSAMFRYPTSRSPMLSKQELSERDICTKYITPALEASGWNKFSQFLEEVSFTDGKIYVKGKLTARGKAKRADYILYYKPNIPIAIVEAKDNKHSVGAGMMQALDYARILDIPFVFSSNGDGFLFHDRTATEGTIETELGLDDFPTPAVLWAKYKLAKGLTSPVAARMAEQEYYFDGSGKRPRYYQQIAINRTVEAVAQGQNRILLVMATGTGKTLTAFHIVHRLWKSGAKKRILFLADRNSLLDQTR
nr:hypothetical protein [Tanacetum cinerariifolium]